MPTLNTSMQGKICMVTGATSGIGKATAMELARMGATVVMVSRDRAKGEAVQSEIKTKSGNDTVALSLIERHAATPLSRLPTVSGMKGINVDLLLADLSSQASIRQLAENFQQHYAQLHVLINNAGVSMFARQETVDGLETTFAVNQLAPFLLTNLLLDVLKASAPARIVNVSSAAQQSASLDMDNLQSKKRYTFMNSYGQSKLALVMFTYELARRLEGTGVTANCLHPGFVATNIGQSGAGPVGRAVVKFIFSNFGISPEEGAKTSIYLATSPDVEGVTGKYFVKSIPKRSAPITYDESLQRQLWDKCAKLVDLPVKV